jgi:hypothetical protein
MPYYLGKLPARPNAVKLKFRNYLAGTQAIQVPSDFGHEEWTNPPISWGMYGNDQYGDCLAEGTLVSGQNASAALKSRYSGQLVTITLLSGKRLTVTPKHGILTTQGFAQAKTIKNGDYLVGTLGSQVLPGATPLSTKGHIDNSPAPVQEVFSSFLIAGSPGRVVMPGAIDLNGDERFLDGNVEIVGANCFLRDELDAPLRKPDTQNKIGTTSQLKSQFVRFCALRQAAWRMLLAAYRDMRSGNYGLLFGPAHLGVAQSQGLSLCAQDLPGFDDLLLEMPMWNSEFFGHRKHGCTRGIFPNGGAHIAVEPLTEQSLGLGHGSWPAASRAKPSSDGFLTNPELFSDLQRRFPGLIEADRVINVDVQGNVRSHIYDLSTNCRWYIADGIVTHNCVIAGGAHEEVLWNRMGGNVIGFNTSDLLRDFSAITGQPPSPSVGADMQQAASYRRTVGLLDASGVRRKIAAYLEILPGNLPELYQAMYLFGAVGVGIQFPTYAFDQFKNHQSWHIVSGGQIEAGHYIPAVALRSNIVCVTWGRFQAMRPSFYSAYCDEVVAYVTQESLVNGKSPEGFDYAQLVADLNALNG